jgi:outer membrane receptor for Fe3+-dicitrate
MFSIEAGAFNSRRILTMLDLMQDADDQSMYFAGEYQESDGPFESPQNFRRINLLGKYHRSFKDNSRLNVTLSRFSSNWDASGQIPNRLVANGQISRFGAVDDTEGGTTSRTNILLDHTKTIDNQSFIKTKGFYSLYDFTLFSNFTFFLENPGLGDQIRQKEKRSTIGLESVLYKSHSHASSNQELQIGLGFRYDDIKGSELSNTLQRTDILNRISFGDIDETNIYGFINWEYNKDRWLVNVGTRLDYFDFQYKDHLLPQYEVNSRNILRLSPKINFLYNPNRDLQLFMKSGIGFHSNDTRVIINREAEEILPAAYGLDLGSIWKPFKNLWISSTLWYLYLEQEFVYVGDAGIVEPSGESRRNGIELGIRYQVMRNLFLSTDLSYTIARSVDSPENENYIPLAPDFIATGNLVYKSGSGFRAGLQSRYIKDRPANEDNSIVALGYFLFNSNLGYDIGNLSFGIQLENILNTSWNESQFATTSRLMNEDRPVEELHFTPGNPRNVRGSIQYRF